MSPEAASGALALLPLAFEANVGQSDPQVRFLARARDMALFVTDATAVLSLAPSAGGTQGAAVRLVPIGSDARSAAEGLDPLPGIVNDLRGDPARWTTGAPTFARVAQRSVWPGIDIVYYGKGAALEYDVVVAPGAEPGTVRLGVEGATGLRVDERGDLVIDTAAGTLLQRRPTAYQSGAESPLPVVADYVLTGPAEVGLRLGPYDITRPLVVDPVLTYSTFVGGTGWEEGGAVAVDGSGAAYVTGLTSAFGAPDFPTTAGAFDTTYNGGNDVFVTKLNPAGSAMVYSTYLGSSGSDWVSGLAVDGAGAAYVTGGTIDFATSDFPTTAGAFDTTYNGSTDVFVTKLNPAGSALVYSTFLGGNGGEDGADIAVDATGAAYVTGRFARTTFEEPTFPTTAGAFDTTYNGDSDVFVAKLNPAGSALEYSTLLGGAGSDEGLDIAIDATGAAYVSGRTTTFNGSQLPTTAGAFDTTHNGGFDAFVTKLNPAGSALVYSTFLGSSGSDEAWGIAVESTGAAYVAGSTYPFGGTSDFPTTPGAFDTAHGGGIDAIVAKLNPAGSGLAYATYLGGPGNDEAFDIALDGAGAASVTGRTTGAGFPTTAGALDTTFGGVMDGFVSMLSPAGSALTYSTYLGGTGSDNAGVGVAVDGSGAGYVAGYTFSAGFPITPGAADTVGAGGEAFVTKFGAPAVLPLTGTYHALTPARILDTRDGTGGFLGAIAPASLIDVPVTGQGGVPASGVSAVVLNVTVTQPTAAAGYLSLFPSGSPLPLASNLNFTPGQNVPNLVIVQVGANGRVSTYNSHGNTHVIFDVAGWFSDTDAGNPGHYRPLVPARILDTRDGTGGGVRLGPNSSLELQVAGAGGVPATGVDAAVLDIVATQTTATSFVTAYPSGVARPQVSNLNFDAGDTVANRAVVKLGANGRVTIYNLAGGTDIVVDVGGWFTDASAPATGGAFVASEPARILDTRDGTGGVSGIRPAATGVEVQVTGRGGVPASGVSAVVLNVTATQPAANGFLTVFPSGNTLPLASDLNFDTGETRPNLAIVQVGTGGKVTLYVSAGTHVIFDVEGWFN